VVLMYVVFLLIGGLLFGTAAFAGSRAYELAGIALALWLAVTLAVAVRKASARKAPARRATAGRKA
jgi:hypothetical protein